MYKQISIQQINAILKQDFKKYIIKIANCTKNITISATNTKDFLRLSTNNKFEMYGYYSPYYCNSNREAIRIIKQKFNLVFSKPKMLHGDLIFIGKFKSNA